MVLFVKRNHGFQFPHVPKIHVTDTSNGPLNNSNINPWTFLLQFLYISP